MINHDINTFDILIVGGGLIGNALAIALENQPLNIGLIDNIAIETRTQETFDVRALALSYGSQRILSHLNIWNSIQPHACPIHHIHISEQKRLGNTRLNACDYQIPALGYIVPMPVLLESLNSRARTLSNLSLFCPATITNVSLNERGYETVIQMHEKQIKLQTKLLIIADGAYSNMREHLQLKQTIHEYEQSAITATIGLTNTHHNTAYERFTKSGPLAMLPLRDQRMSLVWCMKTADAKTILEKSDTEFLAALQKNFGYRLGRLLRVGIRQLFPLRLTQTDELYRPGLLVLGNAAHSLHPVAGQGFNLGLRSVIACADMIIQNKEHDQFCKIDCLKNYVAERTSDRENIIHFTDKLVKLFSNDYLGLRDFRSKGLLAIDLLPPVKDMLARLNMGLWEQTNSKYL